MTGRFATRPAIPADAAAVAAIYNQGIADRIATFETEPRTAEAIAGWFAGPHPVIATVDQTGTLVAFAAAFPYRSRPCYAGIGEFSVYVDRAHRGHGAGLMAVRTLSDAAAAAGFWKLVSRVFVENQASRRMLAAAGFREVGIYQKHGKLDGLWRDCVIVERLLGEAADYSVSG